MIAAIGRWALVALCVVWAAFDLAYLTPLLWAHGSSSSFDTMIGLWIATLSLLVLSIVSAGQARGSIA